MEKIKSLEEQLVEFKIEIEKLTSSKLAFKPKSKEREREREREIYIYIYIFFLNMFLNLEGLVKKI